MSQNRKTPQLETELLDQLTTLEERLEAAIKPLDNLIGRCADAIEDKDLVTARDCFRKAERQVNLIYNILGMRQFKEIPLSEPPPAPTVPTPPAVPVAPPVPAPAAKPRSWWKRFTGTAVLVGSILIVSGCTRTLTQYRESRELAKVEAAKKEIVENQQERVEKGRDFVYGTKEALNRVPDPGPEVKVAKILNDRAGLALGQPPTEEALRLQKMVDDLLSANAELQKNGQAELSRREKDIVSLEERNRDLEIRLKKVEEDRDEKFLENANKAAKWDQENSFLNSINPFHDLAKFVKKLFFLIIFVCLIGVLLKVAAMFFPALAPLSAVVDGVLGGFGRMIFRVAPKAKEAAGVVGAEVHQLSEKTLATLVHAVQDIRYDHGPEIKALADKALSFHNDDETAAKIRQVKEVEGLNQLTRPV